METRADYRKRNAEKINARQREYRKANGDRLRANERKWRSRNVEKIAAYYREQKYGISQAEWNALLEKQNYGCAICGRTTETGRRNLSVDHDHVTGRVRGILCQNCNAGIGHFRDDVDLVRTAVQYLERKA